MRVYLPEVQNQVSYSHNHNKEIGDWHNFENTVGVGVRQSSRISYVCYKKTCHTKWFTKGYLLIPGGTVISFPHNRLNKLS